jgi:hypothetical protein
LQWCTRRIRFNEVPEKVPEVPEKVWEALARNRSSSTGFRKKVLEKVPEKVWEALAQSRVRFNGICGNLTHGNQPEVFPALGRATRFNKKTLRLMGIPPKLINSD